MESSHRRTLARWVLMIPCAFLASLVVPTVVFLFLMSTFPYTMKVNGATIDPYLSSLFPLAFVFTGFLICPKKHWIISALLVFVSIGMMLISASSRMSPGYASGWTIGAFVGIGLGYGFNHWRILEKLKAVRKKRDLELKIYGVNLQQLRSANAGLGQIVRLTLIYLFTPWKLKDIRDVSSTVLPDA